MAKYEYLVADFETGVVREELPLSGVRYDRKLNMPGTFSGNLRYTHPKATRANVDPGRTLLYVRRDGTVVWGGILWSVRKQKGSDYVGLGAQEVWSYFERRRFNHNIAWLNADNVDQFDIFRDMLRYVQGESVLNDSRGPGIIGTSKGADYVDLQFDSGTSGVTREKRARSWERKRVGTVARALANLSDGFDFDIIVTEPTSNTFVHTLKLDYPTKGRRTNFVFEQGKNITLFDWALDAWELENRVVVLGSGEGPDTLTAWNQDVSLLDAGYPLLDGMETRKDITDWNTARKWADKRLNERKLPSSIPLLELRSTEEGEIGGFDLGDEILVRADDGFVSFDDYYRVLEYSVNVSNEGDESMNITVGEVGRATRTGI